MKVQQKIIGAVAACAAHFLLGAAANAALSEAELSQLGTTLTPWGAEIAGTPDGSYPAYTGGIKPPPGFDQKSGMWPDPYPDDKPLFSIDATNMEQYKDRLMEAQMELMRRYPTFRMDIYPTRRSAWIPERIANNSLANARNPECKTSANGVGVYGCWGGTPFPIPKNGYEAMWNHLLFYTTPGEFNSSAFLVNANGATTRSRSPTKRRASITCALSPRPSSPRARPARRRCCGTPCATTSTTSARGATRPDSAVCAWHRNSPTTPRWRRWAA